MFDSERSIDPECDVVVVAAGSAYSFYYLKWNAYVCQPNRTFRRVKRIAFYTEKYVQVEIPVILEESIAQVVSRSGIDDLRSQGRPKMAKFVERMLAEESDRDGSRVDIYLLSEPDSDKTLRLASPLRHNPKGAYTPGHRYTSEEKLRVAKSTEDL